MRVYAAAVASLALTSAAAGNPRDAPRGGLNHPAVPGEPPADGKISPLPIDPRDAPRRGGNGGRVVRVAVPRRVEVFVPAGRFVMGVDEDAAQVAVQQCELAYPALSGIHPQTGKPVGFCSVDYEADLVHMRQRDVFLDAFAIDRDEVSVADYRRCVAAGGCDLDALISGDERYIHDDWPLVNVTWLEAGDYCRWRGARLPTEAEWERAARGDDIEATWPWGSVERPKDFNHGQPRAEAMREIERPQQTMVVPASLLGDPDDSDGTVLIAPVGKYVWGEGPYGTRDQAGNVAEWTADAYVHDDNEKGYDSLTAINPVREPKAGELTPMRVVRGGSWRQPVFVAHANLRDPFNRLYQQNLRFSHIGFRCARSLRGPAHRALQGASGGGGTGASGMASIGSSASICVMSTPLPLPWQTLGSDFEQIPLAQSLSCWQRSPIPCLHPAIPGTSVATANSAVTSHFRFTAVPLPAEGPRATRPR